MELQERLVVNYEDICNVVRRVTDEVKDLRSDSFIRRILSDRDQDALRRWEDLLNKRISDPFSIVIMGDFKRGKSTLINSLLGKSLAPVNVTPETVTINRIMYGEESAREAVLTNGMRIRLEAEELGREELEKVMQNLPAPIEYIDIRDNNEFLKDIAIVDTPGMGDVLSEFDAKVQSYIDSADAVIYVASALSPLSESEQVFLSGKLNPNSFSRLFIVVNMTDCLDTTEDAERIKALITERARAVSVSAAVYAVSALDEFCRKLGKKRPNPDMTDYLESAYKELDSALNSDMILQRDVIKSERLVTISDKMLEDTRNRIRLIGNMLGIKKSELQEMEQKCYSDMANIDSRLKKSEDAIRELATEYRREADGWMDEYLDKLWAEVATLVTQPTIVLQKNLQFYLMEKLKLGVTACVGEHKPGIEQKMKDCAKEFISEQFTGLDEANVKEIGVQLTDITWTDVDTATFYINEASTLIFGQENNIGSIVNAVTLVAGGILRESKVKKQQADIINPLLAKKEEISQSVHTRLAAIYDSLGDNACKRLEEIFKNQLNISIDALAQAQKVLKEEDIREEDLREKLKLADDILTRANNMLENTGILHKEAAN